MESLIRDLKNKLRNVLKQFRILKNIYFQKYKIEVSILKKFMEYFDGGKWKVLYKAKDEEKYKILEGEKNYWYADPFLFNFNGIEYLFTEAFDEQKLIGSIAVSVLKNDIFSVPQVVISNPYHMSYPDVFRYKGNIFMLPETCENRTLEIYKATDFPYKWEKRVLLDNVNYVDTTVFINKEEVFLMAFNDMDISTTIYSLDMDSLVLKKSYNKRHSEKRYRPAGNIYKFNGKLYRPVQNCEKTYGESLIINEILDFEHLKEEFVKEIQSKEIKKENYCKIHTLNRDNGYEVIDVYEQDWGLKFFMDRIRSRLHKLKFRLSKEFIVKGSENVGSF
jgi:hypothetical protein